MAVLLPVAAPAQDDPVTILLLGDSLSAGYGLAAGEGLAPQLQAWLDEAGASVEIVNAGVSGDTTAGGLSRLDWALTDEVDAVIVQLGGNDFLRGIDPAASRENLRGILEGIAARDLPVLLVGIDASGQYGPDYEAAFDGMYPDLAAEFGAALIPDFFAPLREGGTLDAALRDWMQPDGIHPNAAGVRRIVAGSLGPAALALAEEARR
ncbi:Lysophospholipase L1 [Rubellimicrobium thermophilum DSM 16684]|uniref:Lysophospholipase L1 n=1 Tax=Rubellimicrobium thermophilum DSM 16684 TaxID=1123069 RepID=S9QY81_9RHOB|nr:arylesterase [Rubellimicrobium thermophilum]EPX86351.1 Lysophospholipase L1 [Rubellimicrobium thermophilum DSM 16684]